MYTCTHFKDTDRNSYIPTTRGHHPKWLAGIPKGQLMCIERSYDLKEDYEEQSKILIDSQKKDMNNNIYKKSNKPWIIWSREELLSHKHKKNEEFDSVDSTEQYKKKLKNNELSYLWTLSWLKHSQNDQDPYIDNH